MSFRIRVLALIVLVTVTSTAATAWLTLRIATQQAQRTVTAGEQDIQRITGELTRYGREHHSWSGVGVLATALAQQTGQRVELVTESGRVLADSNTGGGPVSGAPLVVDARPALQLPTQLEPGGVANTIAGSAAKITVTAIGTYHYQDRLRHCLIDAGIALTSFPGAHGIDLTEPAEPSKEANGCKRVAESAYEDFNRHAIAAEQCMPLSEAALRDCLRDTFLRQIADVAPEPLRVYIGTPAKPAAVPAMPVAGVAALIALIAVIGMLLLSRHVLKPIRALTVAADGLGKGRLGDRVPVAGGGELASLSGAFNRMAQALQESEDRQRRLTADIAHELRSPLTNLRGYLEALADGTAAPSKELFFSLRDEALLQQRIIDDLQDLALAEAGQLTYRRTRMNLSELVAGYRFSTEIHTVVSANAPAYVDGDPDRLRQVVSNLVRNAVTATPADGTVTLTVGRNGPWAELVVSDNGSGIAPDDLPHLFDRFWRADKARRRGSGVGLGLAIVHQIITDHGGTISVNSKRGTGTVFVIRLPARD